MSEIKRYVKRPVEVEAWLYSGDQDEAISITGWINSNNGKSEVNYLIDFNYDVIYIYTLEGVMTARPGDYIIKGVAGEFYPCKPEIFVETYRAWDDFDFNETAVLPNI